MTDKVNFDNLATYSNATPLSELVPGSLKELMFPLIILSPTALGLICYFIAGVFIK